MFTELSVIKALEDPILPCPERILVETEAASARVYIPAATDAEAVREYLREFVNSPNTLRTYRKELERFLLWTSMVARKTFRELDRDDIHELTQFLANPPADWIGIERAPRGSEKWRPFRKPLAGDALHQALRVVNSLLEWLVTARYLPGNPMGLIRQKRHLAKGSGERPPRERRHRLTPDAVAYVLRALMALPDGTQRQREEKARSQVVFEVFLATGARRMELCTATYDNLECAANRWWLTVNAKGGGYGRLPICERALDSIKRYRVVRGLPPLPEATERGRIITRLGSPDEGISDNMLYRIVKRVFANAVDLANQAGADTVQHQLKRASTHWLRHTTLGSLGEQSKDFRLVQQMGRHASANTTMQYMHEEENRFHDAVAKHLDQLLTVTVPGDA